MENRHSLEDRIGFLELELENAHKRIDAIEPIVNDYGNRNIIFRIIGVICVINLLLLLILGI